MDAGSAALVLKSPGYEYAYRSRCGGKSELRKSEIASAPESHPPETLAGWVLFFQGAVCGVQPLKGHLIFELAVSLKRYPDTRLKDAMLKDTELEETKT